jgi:predicted nucleic acid-binding Zn ribbon protein
MQAFHACKISENLSNSIKKLLHSKVVGEYISSHTAKTYFANGILTVYLDSAALRNELMFARSNLIRYLNEVIGNEIVKDVKIR